MAHKRLLQKDLKNENIITVPQALDIHELQSMAFGSKLIDATIIPSEKQENILISENLWNELGLPFEQQSEIELSHHTLRIHPLVGVITTHFTGSKLNPIGQRTEELSRLLTLANQYGIYMFLFSPDHIHWNEETIEGLFLYKGEWSKKNVPFPDVIYDKIPNRRTERKEVLQEAKAKFIEDYQIPWFNNGFLNKWETYRKLDIHASASSYLPETKEGLTKELLEAFVEKHDHVYLKPKRSSHGLGIFQVIKKAGHYYCRFNDQGENKLRRFKSLTDLLQYQLDEKYYSLYTIQQGISLIEHENQPTDFRIHTNKDGNGEWQVSAVAAKVAGKGSPTTHVAYGGQIKTLQEVFGDEAKNYFTKLSKVAIITSRVIDQQFEGNIAELGLDIGIDKSGNLWVFEANAKPGNMIFTLPNLKKQELYTKKLLFDYMIYLSNRSLKLKNDLIPTS